MELIKAAESGSLTKVKQAFDRKIIEYKDENGLTALAVAARGGSLRVLKFLINKGAVTNTVNKVFFIQIGQSPLFLACWNNNLGCVKALIEARSDLNTSDKRGWTPLIISVYHNYLNIVKLLVQQGADLNHKDTVNFRQFGKTALDRANSPELMGVLQNAIKRQRQVTVSNAKPPASHARSRNQSVRSFSIDHKSSISSSVSQYQYFPIENREKEEKRFIKQDLQQYIEQSTQNLHNRLAKQLTQKLQEIIVKEIQSSEKKLINDLEKLVSDQTGSLYGRLSQVSKTSYQNFRPELQPAGFNRHVLNTQDFQFTEKSVKIQSGDLISIKSQIREQIKSLQNRILQFSLQSSTQIIKNQLEKHIEKTRDFLSTQIQQRYDQLDQFLFQSLQSLVKERQCKSTMTEPLREIFQPKEQGTQKAFGTLLYLPSEDFPISLSEQPQGTSLVPQAEPFRTGLDNLRTQTISPILPDQQYTQFSEAIRIPFETKSIESYDRQLQTLSEFNYETRYIEQEYKTPPSKPEVLHLRPESSQSNRLKQSSGSRENFFQQFGSMEQNLPRTDVSAALKEFLKFEVSK